VRESRKKPLCGTPERNETFTRKIAVSLRRGGGDLSPREEKELLCPPWGNQFHREKVIPMSPTRKTTLGSLF